MRRMFSPASKMLPECHVRSTAACLVAVTFFSTGEILSFRLGYSTTYMLYMKHIHAISKAHITETDYDTVTPSPPCLIM